MNARDTASAPHPALVARAGDRFDPESTALHGSRLLPAPCECCQGARHGRRLFGRLLLATGAAAALPATAKDGEGIEVGKNSRWTKLVPAEQVEQAAAQQYLQLQREAASKGALAPPDHPQLIRLRYIAQRMIPYANTWNARAQGWRWEVNLLGSAQVNAFCMPGGKIAFFHGILAKLQLSDDEVAVIMGHEMAHALREHAREQMGKQTAARVGANVLSGLLGLGSVGDAVTRMGAELLSLRFGREDESEADLVGLELAARTGYQPAAGVSLWQKMGELNRDAPPQWLSTHPSGPSRIKDIEANLPKVQPLFAKAEKPSRRFAAPPPPKQG
jgi:predicted Zn-dependent protease